jgi:hypothetical protein
MLNAFAAYLLMPRPAVVGGCSVGGHLGELEGGEPAQVARGSGVRVRDAAGEVREVIVVPLPGKVRGTSSIARASPPAG